MDKKDNVSKDIFYENDVVVTKTIVKVLRWLVLVFPIMMIFSAIGLFQSKITDLLILGLIGIVVTWGPTVASKMNASVNTLKYMATLAIAALIAIMASNPAVGIYVTYGLAMVFSIFYYDKKFTLRISIVSFLLLVISLYFRSLGVQQVEFPSNFTWFVSRSVGFLMEVVVMTFVCTKIADVSHRMLEKLNDTKKVASLVDKCNEASQNLGNVVKDLEGSINDFRNTNDVISNSAEMTLGDCNSSLEYVGTMADSMKDMDDAVDVIAEKSGQMLHIADQTTEKMNNYITIMEETAEGMQKIEQSANTTGQSIHSLEEGIKEVSEFASEIGRITQ